MKGNEYSAAAAVRRNAIYQHLKKTRREMTTKQIAVFSDSTINTAYTDANTLRKSGFIKQRIEWMGRGGRVSYWRYAEAQPSANRELAPYAVAGPRTIHAAMMPPMTEPMPWHQPPTNVNRRVF